jgi:WD40 repeat protein
MATGSDCGVAFSSDGKRLFLASLDITLKIWNVEISEPQSSAELYNGGDLLGVLRGHSGCRTKCGLGLEEIA